jgi:hypothetical protein
MTTDNATTTAEVVVVTVHGDKQKRQDEIDLLRIAKAFAVKELFFLIQDLDSLHEALLEDHPERIMKFFMIFYGSYETTTKRMNERGFTSLVTSLSTTEGLTMSTFEEKAVFIKNFISDIHCFCYSNGDESRMAQHTNIMFLVKYFDIEVEDDLEEARERLIDSRSAKRLKSGMPVAV